MVRDVALAGNVSAPATRFQIYHNMAQNPWGYFTLVTRSRMPGMLADPLRRGQLGQAGRLSVEKHFSARRMCEQFSQVTDRLVRATA